MDYLDKTLIPSQFPEVSTKAIDQIIKEPLCFEGNELQIQASSTIGWRCNFDTTSVCVISDYNIHALILLFSFKLATIQDPMVAVWLVHNQSLTDVQTISFSLGICSQVSGTIILIYF